MGSTPDRDNNGPDRDNNGPDCDNNGPDRDSNGPDRDSNGIDPLAGGLYTGSSKPGGGRAAYSSARPLLRAAARLACCQLALGVIAGALLILFGHGFGAFRAALIGAFIAFAGTCCVATLTALCAGGSPGRVLSGFYFAEFMKWALLAVLLLVTFNCMQSEALSLLIGFIAAQFAAWPAFMFGLDERPPTPRGRAP